MTDNTYNGWKNWETWNVALWCDNEEAIYRDRYARKEDWDAQAAEAFVRERFPEGTPDMTSERNDPYDRDAVKVDWNEIAEHWQSDLDEARKEDVA